MKLKNSKVTFIIFASPVLSAIIGLFSIFDVQAGEWIEVITTMILAHSALFLPLLTGVLAALVCRYEHESGGWKQTIALPIPRIHTYVAKYLIVITLLAGTQIAFFIAVWLVGTVQGFTDPFPWMNVIMSVSIGWLACLPLASLQLWLATIFTSFAGPSVVNVMLTLPAIVIANSELLGPLYPWAHPLLSMTQAFSYSMGGDAGFLASATTFYMVMGASFLIFTIGGSVYFQKKEWD